MPSPTGSIIHLETQSIWGYHQKKNKAPSATMQIGSHHKRINKAPSPSSSIRHSQQHYQNHFVPHSSIAHNVQEDQYGTFTNRFYKNRMPLLTYLLSYLLTPWSTVLLEKLTAFQLVKKFPALY